MDMTERSPEFPVATMPAPGVMAVDWEQRIDFDRLRSYRLARARQALEESDLGALLVFDTANIRYLTATHIGYWAFNKMERWALLTRTGDQPAQLDRHPDRIKGGHVLRPGDLLPGRRRSVGRPDRGTGGLYGGGAQGRDAVPRRGTHGRQ